MPPELSREVHVWRADLAAGAEALAAAEALLTGEERAWAARGAPGVAQRRVLRRAALRRVLAECVSADPRDLRFTPGPDGKPELEGGGDVRFNASSSEDLALVAVTAAGPVGVDVERLRAVAYLERVTRRFAPEVAARIVDGDDEHRRRTFFAAWTRSEAYVKAVGRGLGLSLDRFAVALDGDPRMLAVEEGDPAAWQVLAFEPAPGFAAAAVTRPGAGAPALALRLRELPGDPPARP